VRARCLICRLKMAVDLFRVASEKGPETSLWGRDASYRRSRCRRRMVFEAKAPGMVSFKRLAGQPMKREPDR
jgi:hypothetical protein